MADVRAGRVLLDRVHPVPHAKMPVSVAQDGEEGLEAAVLLARHDGVGDGRIASRAVDAARQALPACDETVIDEQVRARPPLQRSCAAIGRLPVDAAAEGFVSNRCLDDGVVRPDIARCHVHFPPGDLVDDGRVRGRVPQRGGGHELLLLPRPGPVDPQIGLAAQVVELHPQRNHLPRLESQCPRPLPLRRPAVDHRPAVYVQAHSLLGLGAKGDLSRPRCAQTP